MNRVVGVLTAMQEGDLPRFKGWFEIAGQSVRAEFRGKHGRYSEWFTSSAPDRDLKPWLWKWASDARSELEMYQRLARGWAQRHINDALRGSQDESRASARVLFKSAR